MLTKRTNILFDESMWNMLVRLSRRKKTSVGNLIRKAIKKVYVSETNQNNDSLHPLDKIKQLVKKNNIKGLSAKEIKEYINYGRKY